MRFPATSLRHTSGSFPRTRSPFSHTFSITSLLAIDISRVMVPGSWCRQWWDSMSRPESHKGKLLCLIGRLLVFDYPVSEPKDECVEVQSMLYNTKHHFFDCCV